MFDGLKREWQALKRGKPGSRFQEQYRRRQEAGRRPWRKPLFFGGGILIIAAGIFLVPAPGPGFLVLLIGAGLIAQESRHAAGMLDWIELRGRRMAAWGLRTWQHAAPALKALFILLAILAAAAAAWAAYALFLSG